MQVVVVVPFAITLMLTWPDEHGPDDDHVLLVHHIHFDYMLVSDQLTDAHPQALLMPIQNAEHEFSFLLMYYDQF